MPAAAECIEKGGGGFLAEPALGWVAAQGPAPSQNISVGTRHDGRHLGHHPGAGHRALARAGMVFALS